MVAHPLNKFWDGKPHSHVATLLLTDSDKYNMNIVGIKTDKPTNSDTDEIPHLRFPISLVMWICYSIGIDRYVREVGASLGRSMPGFLCLLSFFSFSFLFGHHPHIISPPIYLFSIFNIYYHQICHPPNSSSKPSAHFLRCMFRQ